MKTIKKCYQVIVIARKLCRRCYFKFYLVSKTCFSCVLTSLFDRRLMIIKSYKSTIWISLSHNYSRNAITTSYIGYLCSSFFELIFYLSIVQGWDPVLYQIIFIVRTAETFLALKKVIVMFTPVYSTTCTEGFS